RPEPARIDPKNEEPGAIVGVEGAVEGLGTTPRLGRGEGIEPFDRPRGDDRTRQRFVKGKYSLAKGCGAIRWRWRRIRSCRDRRHATEYRRMSAATARHRYVRPGNCRHRGGRRARG